MLASIEAMTMMTGYGEDNNNNNGIVDIVASGKQVSQPTRMR